MENIIDSAIFQDWFYLVVVLGGALLGALIYDYLRRKSGTRKFKR